MTVKSPSEATTRTQSYTHLPQNEEQSPEQSTTRCWSWRQLQMPGAQTVRQLLSRKTGTESSPAASPDSGKIRKVSHLAVSGSSHTDSPRLSTNETDHPPAQNLLSPSKVKASLKACRERNIVSLREELDKNPDLIDHPFTSGKEKIPTTLLHHAAFHDWSQGAELLLNCGAKINAKDGKGWAPIHLAANKKAIDVIDTLARNNADIDLKLKLGCSPLHAASRNKDPEAAKTLVNHNANVNTTDDKGRTPLHVSAQYNCHQVAELLISKNANLDTTMGNGATALHYAAAYGHYKVVRKLIAAGSDPDIKFNGLTALQLAQLKKPWSLPTCTGTLFLSSSDSGFKEKRKKTKHFNKVIKAIQKKQQRTTLTESRVGIKTETTTSFSTTTMNQRSLWNACKEGDTEEAVKILNQEPELINQYLPSDMKKHLPATPLIIASFFNQIALVRKLLEMDACIDKEIATKHTALHVAAQEGHHEVMVALLAKATDKATDINAKTKKGFTPLHIAADKGYLNVVQLLVNHGANISEKTNNHDTALDLSRSNNKEVTNFLETCTTEKETATGMMVKRNITG